MNTPKHATDEQINELWERMCDQVIEQMRAPHGTFPGLSEWMQSNERRALS